MIFLVVNLSKLWKLIIKIIAKYFIDMSCNIIHGPPDPTFQPDPRGLGVVLLENMKKHGDKIAQINADTNEMQTYNELLLRSIRIAQQMHARGINKSDIITLCSKNIMDAYATFLAATYLGIIISALDPTLSPSDVKHLLLQVNPRFIFCGPESIDLIETATKYIDFQAEIVVYGETKKYIPFSEFLVSSGTEDAFEARPAESLFDTAVIFFSSGTTGMPKGICATHYGFLCRFSTDSGGNKLQSLDINRLVYFTTLYWISAVAILILSVLNGSTRILANKFENEYALRIIEKYKASFLFVSPFIMQQLVKYPKILDYNTASLNSIAIGGAVLGENQMLEAKKYFPECLILNGYGMTEAHGAVTIFDPVKDIDFIKSKPSSVGRCIPELNYKIVDTDTEEILGANRVGELRIKGKCLMNGYFKKSKETEEAYDSEGYLRTGDIGYYDEDQCFYIVDRCKEIFKYQSWHISPADLESVLLTHPDIKDAAVIGYPHEIDGFRAMGIVVIRPGSTVTEKEILNFFNGKVSDRKKLHAGIRFVDSLPYTPTGKLQRRYLNQKFITEKA